MAQELTHYTPQKGRALALSIEGALIVDGEWRKGGDKKEKEKEKEESEGRKYVIGRWFNLR